MLVPAMSAIGQIDFTGDGTMEVAFSDPGNGALSILDLTVNQDLWRVTQGGLFGWAASAHPDLDWDGLPDVIVSDPAFGTGGKVVALCGRDGAVLWTSTYGDASTRFGIGLGVIPDQDSDNVADVLVAMLSDDPSGETVVLVSGKTGNLLTTASGPLSVLLNATRTGLFEFKPKDQDGSGVLDVTDVSMIVDAIGTDDPDADLDFSGIVDFEDLLKIINEIGVPNTSQLLPSQYGLLVLEDPLQYESGLQLVALATSPFIPAPADHPCAAEFDAMRMAYQDWGLHLKNIPWNPLSPTSIPNPITWWHWSQRSDILRDRARLAMATLNRCLTQHGLPNLTKPTQFLPPYIPPATPPATPTTPAPPTGTSLCLLTSLYPPSSPIPGYPIQDPCAFQLESNTILCIACIQHSLATESLDACMKRAKAIKADCTTRLSTPVVVP